MGAAFFKMGFLTYTTNYFSWFGVDILILSWTRPTFLCILPLQKNEIVEKPVIPIQQVPLSIYQIAARGNVVRL